MSSSEPARFTARHVQLARAALAAVAAVMITFSPDHSAPTGLAAFSGFGIATGLVLALSAWLVFGEGRRGVAVLLAALFFVPGMVAGLTGLRSTAMFFGVVIGWALVAGIAELASGIVRRRRGDADARDAIVVGALTVLLGLATAVVPAGYSLDYVIEEAGSFTLTGITIAVGLFGGYAAIVAVYLGIAGLSPSATAADTTDGGAGGAAGGWDASARRTDGSEAAR